MVPVDSEISKALAPEFEIVRSLGEGSVATVYLARDVALRRLVALKVMRPEVAQDSVARRRFEREGRSVARLSHPNVVAVHRVGALPDGRPYLVMQYVEGRNLADTLEATGPLRLPEARQILQQVAGGLAAAHAEGIIHRDVKPANVVWTRETGKAVLMDFGIAGILETGSVVVTRLTQAGQLLGDPAHMSPEQVMGETLTEATDVYSLGILGYEILTREGPYRANSRLELTAAHLQQEPRSLTELRPEAGPDLAKLLLRCLAKKPEHRPRAAEVARLLAPEAAKPAHPRSGDLAGASLSSATEAFPALHAFLEELRRRRVFNVAILYGVVAFALLQVVPTVLDALSAPAWFLTATVAVVLVGFPVTLVLAWIYDITSSGIRRSAASPATGPRSRILLLQLLGLCLSLLLAGAIAWWMLKSRS